MQNPEKEQYTYRGVVFAISILILMLFLSFYSLVTYRKNLNAMLADVTRRNMERYNEQGILLFDTMISDYFQQLDLIARFCSIGTGVHDDKIIELLDRCNEDGSYVRFGISGINGELYTGSGRTVDISNQDFFKKALKDEPFISDVEENGYNGRDVIVLTIPIKRGDDVAGIACAQYDVQFFTDQLGSSQFKGAGATMVMQRNGRMVSGYEGMENFDTFYEALEEMDFRGEDTLTSLRQRIKAGETGFFTYYKNHKARYLYFTPTGIRDYTMISLVLAESMDNDAHKISMQALFLTIKNIVFYCVILLCVWVLSAQIRRLVRCYQRDPLTKADNKVNARREIDRFLARAGKGATHSLFFMDIDNFKQINDQYGHQTGDTVLVEFSRILKQNFRPSDIICRYGGDEFLVFMRDIPSPETAKKKAARLAEALSRREGVIPFTISIGTACYPKDGADFKTLLYRADQALYLAKKEGKNNCHVWDPRVDADGYGKQGEKAGEAEIK